MEHRFANELCYHCGAPEGFAAEECYANDGWPKEIHVCGQRYQIFRGRSWTHGYIDIVSGRIHLSHRLAEAYAREVLLHEIIHGVDRHLNDGTDVARFLEGEIDRPKDKLGMKLKEPEVLTISRGLWWTLTDPRNAAVVKWMLGAEVAI